jgi:hypothetical protein
VAVRLSPGARLAGSDARRFPEAARLGVVSRAA